MVGKMFACKIGLPLYIYIKRGGPILQANVFPTIESELFKI